MTDDRHDDDVDEWLDEQDERQALESAYWAELGALFAGPTLPALAAVRCRACQVEGRRRPRHPLGRVLSSPVGLLLTIETPRLILRALPPTDGPAETLTPSEAPDHLAVTTPDGWILAGPDTVAARLPWWFDVDLDPVGPPSRFGRPAVVCPTHDRIPVDPTALAARVRAGSSRVDV